MRRSIFMLAAGLLTAGTLLTGGVASAGTTAVHHRADCTNEGSAFLHVTKSGVNYFVGTPNTTFAGAVVRLKPRTNITTLWTFCFDGGDEFALYNRGLVMTSRDRNPGQLVTVEVAGNFGNGFASQRWHASFSGDTVTLTNVKSGLSLRVRNSGPIMGQTVTTGFTATTWILSS
jgi:hypothetical protein